MKKTPQWKVDKIKELLTAGELSVAVIAQRFWVSKGMIWRIKREMEESRENRELVDFIDYYLPPAGRWGAMRLPKMNTR